MDCWPSRLRAAILTTSVFLFFTLIFNTRMKKIVLTLLLISGMSLGSYAQMGGLGGFVKKAAGAAQQAAGMPAGAGAAASDAATGGSVADTPVSGVISPVHAKNKGRIVFSSNVDALTTQKENEAGFGSTFTLGKPIYFRAYMANSLSNMAQRLMPDVSRGIIDVHALYRMKFYLDGALVFTGVLRDFSEELKQYATFKGALQTGDDQEYMGMTDFRLFLAQNEKKLTPGSHKLKIELLPALEYPEEREGPVAAAGEITLNVGTSTANPNDTKTCLPAAGMKDAALEAKILQAFKAKGWTEKPSAVRITGMKWNIVRNELTSVIIKRSVAAVVASTMKDGNCRYQDFLFSQDYDGAAYQPEVYMDGVGSPHDIPCGCLK